MIKAFLKERRSWVILFFLLQLLTLFIGYVDASISLSSVIYIVFLSLLIFVLFLIVRYKKETPFYQRLKEWDTSFDLEEIPTASTPFEKIVEESLTGHTQKQKQQATRDQTALEQERDDLMSWIHEVKTPLTAMHLIIERMENEEMKTRLMYEWLRIHLLLDQQLHQKRINFIENDLYVEKVELERVIFMEIKGLQSWCIQKGIGFEVELEVKEVLSDEKWLAFILRQLLTNAVKYSSDSDIVINSWMENGHAVLEVKDSGDGMDPKDLPRIYDKGFTSTSRQDHAATGMGLYLAKKAAESLMVKINVNSTPGSGTTFTLTFSKENEFVNLTRM